MYITLYGAPLCFPSQNPLSVHLVLLVAAHHSKRDHLLLSAQMQTWRENAEVFAPTYFQVMFDLLQFPQFWIFQRNTYTKRRSNRLHLTKASLQLKFEVTEHSSINLP